MGSPTIFKGTGTLFLTDNLEYKDGSKDLKNDSDNPNTTAKNALAGSEYHQSGTNKKFKKLVDGNNIKWKDVDASPDLIYHLNADWADIDQFATGQNATFDGGGTLGGTFSRSTTAADLINGSACFKLVGDALASNNTNDYVAFEAIDIPQGFRNNYIGLYGHYKWDGSNNILVRVKDTTNGTVITGDAEALEGFTSIDNTAKRFAIAIFIPSDCTQIEIGFQVGTGEASKTLIFDEIKLLNDPFRYLDLQDVLSYRAYTGAGFGSSANKIPYFTNEETLKSSSIGTIENSSTSGWSYTAIVDQRVVFSFTYFSDNGNPIGITKNSAQLSTSINSVTAADRVAYGWGTATDDDTNTQESITFSGFLAAGDVLRPHTNGINNSSDTNRNMLSIVAVSEKSHAVVPAQTNLTDWVSYGTIDIIDHNLSTFSKGSTNHDVMWWRRVGDSMEIRFEYEQTSTGQSGSGDYLISIPSGYTIDLSKFSRTSGTNNDTRGAIVGVGYVSNNNSESTSSYANAVVSVFDSTQVRVMIDIGTNFGKFWSSDRNGLGSSATINAGATFTVPIDGWGSNASFLAALPTVNDSFKFNDGVTAPSTVANQAQMYVDSSDGDLKIKFGDGTVKTIVTDT